MKQEIKSDKQLLNEEEVILKAQTRPEAFREIYEKYYKPIFLFILHRLGDKELTADLTSQVFLKALLNLRKFQFRGLPFSSWLYRIAVNECNDFFRKTKRARLVVLDEHHAEMLYEEMFGNEFIQELINKLPQILARLNEDELQLIELRFLEGRSFKDVADILNISEIYAKVKTYRTLEKMKKLFLKNEK